MNVKKYDRNNTMKNDRNRKRQGRRKLLPYEFY